MKGFICLSGLSALIGEKITLKTIFLKNFYAYKLLNKLYLT